MWACGNTGLAATQGPVCHKRPPVVAFRSETRDLLEHGIRAAAGTEAPGPTAADHLRTLVVLDAIVESSRSGRRLVLSEIVTRLGIADVMA